MTSVTSWPNVPGLVLYLTAGTSVLDAALADRDFILEADETVLVVGTTDFSFDDATLSHSDTTGDNEEYTGVVIVTWTEGEPGLVAGETVDFRLVKRNRPEEAQFSQHDTPAQLPDILVENFEFVEGFAQQSLDSNTTKLAQQFTTGIATAGYTLGSIGIRVTQIDDVHAAFGELTVTLNADNSGNPGDVLCTLSDPRSWTEVFPFAVPAACPTLDANKAYFVVIERVAFTAGGIRLSSITDGDENKGRAAGWSIGNDRHIFSAGSWSKTTGSVLRISIRNGVDLSHRRASEDFTLATGNNEPSALWSDRTTMWVADDDGAKIFAYNMATKQRDSAKDFNTLTVAGNDAPAGIWSDGTTMWVVDEVDSTIYAYDMATKQRDTDKEVLGTLPNYSGELWVDNDTTWVLKRAPPPVAVLAWDTETGNRKDYRDFNGLHFNDNMNPEGIWADGSDMFVSDYVEGRVYAYWKHFKVPNARRDFLLSPAAGQVSWRQRRRWRDLVEWDHDLGCGLCARQALRIRPSSQGRPSGRSGCVCRARHRQHGPGQGGPCGLVCLLPRNQTGGITAPFR